MNDRPDSSQPAPPTPARRRSLASVSLQAAAELVITASVLVMLFGIWQLTWNDAQIRSEQDQLTRSVEHTWTAQRAVADQVTRPKYKVGAPIAVLHIPRFGRDWKPRTVVQGVADAELARGAGHYPDTALPGEVGNFAVAGHRQTHGSAFEPIAELKIGDPLVVETRDTWFIYRVTSTQIVAPTDRQVIDPVPSQPGVTPTKKLMTLTSCHPMYSSKERYIVHAVLDRQQPRLSGRPTELKER